MPRPPLTPRPGDRDDDRAVHRHCCRFIAVAGYRHSRGPTRVTRRARRP